MVIFNSILALLAGVGIGALVTGIIQSSAATIVMAIGFVNVGTMTLSQATSVIMGANIGTTITGLLFSLSCFDIEIYASVLAFILHSLEKMALIMAQMN